jgi:hypothetical protein
MTARPAAPVVFGISTVPDRPSPRCAKLSIDADLVVDEAAVRDAVKLAGCWWRRG